ncbi:ATP-dependent DNA ligase [Ponticoccus sp. SC2-23]|uniref:ATP-dependent DNA ligase n=1 Tax=Alexandriicola marinus TaxID=2081710 RepID=UPI000FD75AD8|nr:ATP-dependent DNA ligase [Alexandriicola marinus]MBM1221074.1 ATP-dependent DNA ligase [Ponticoccus sp. SC6-9]MBM1225644.1 ATP-dependent DNA ligase [Ponticoccus sp. SC6-15]MBM1227796.1 ATP-dependent DNA ligase [Ponticoccus sp. SC6-38]MBM1234566.1 ATP-dependent DNA ligase [Ponticoccus sp. SC6-45]MBM1238298.1 ATP-dependent DNA ligase [Ponticoccus sp. SC6-49]MBM1243567.1 ATP-dependent DNA ligase [Ponticoccus sp. SC2-64]MBM1248090.1 ATP-dependent DNA ligase [Ponticoccus sp. SC6-42]MBM1252698
MKDFAELFTRVDQTTRTSRKVAALTAFFQSASDADKLWCIALFSGRRPRRVITATVLREWAAEQAGIPLWLFEEAYPVVGDLAETISLVLPPPSREEDRPLSDWIAHLRTLSAQDDAARKVGILAAWDVLPDIERFLFTKLLTGGFRVGVSQKLMTRALAQATGIDEAELTHRLMGDWTPDTVTWTSLIEAPDPTAALSRPYPFYLAYQLEKTEEIEPVSDWFAERKWDGIRGQLIVREGEHHLWSRGEELMTDRFPEFATLKDFLPDGTVIDGEVLAFADDAPLPFAALQKRIGRKTVPRKLLSEAPAILMAYDLLEQDGTDIRAQPFDVRRAALARIIGSLPDGLPLRLSPEVVARDLEGLTAERALSRDLGAEGLMLKRRSAPYLAGRKKGDWWKWKVDPLTIDAVMIYAQAGHGRRANLFTDFTFAVRDGDDLVPFTKAYSGLTDAEFRQITAWVRKNTLQRFGPVRQVRPEHVFEIAFEGIQSSTRHKSGVALRFPRMARWRQDKPVAEANTLRDLHEMLTQYGS